MQRKKKKTHAKVITLTVITITAMATAFIFLEYGGEKKSSIYIYIYIYFKRHQLSIYIDFSVTFRRRTIPDQISDFEKKMRICQTDNESRGCARACISLIKLLLIDLAICPSWTNIEGRVDNKDESIKCLASSASLALLVQQPFSMIIIFGSGGANNNQRVSAMCIFNEK